MASTGTIQIPIEIQTDPAVVNQLGALLVSASEIHDALINLQLALSDLGERMEVVTSMVGGSLLITDQMRRAIVATKEEMLAAVEGTTTVGQSIIAALDLNTQLLREALESEGLDQDLIDRVTASASALNADIQAAVVRNTVAEDEPEPAPPA